MLVAALPLGLAIGATVGVLGGGGAVLAVPILVYLLGEDVHAATTTSLAVVAAAALTGAIGQASRDEVCWPQVAAFAPAAIVGTIGGTLANQAVSGEALLIAFALVMFVAAWFTWRKSEQEADESATGACPPLRRPRTIAAGLIVGAMTGFFGVGGGFLVVPMLALAMRFPMRRAIGTSLVIVAFISLVGLAAHLWQGSELDGALTAVLVGGCVVGALAGSRLSVRVPQRTLGHAFTALVVVVASYVLIASAFFGGPSGS